MNDNTLRGLRKQALRAAQLIGWAKPNPESHDDSSATPGGLCAAECQALRQTLLLTQAEAAAWLSTPPVSERAWQYWEAGKRAVPADVAANLRSACAQREHLMATALAAIEQQPGHKPVAVWYAKADDWKWTMRGIGPDWKLHNSVVAQLACQGRVQLVAFDEAAYVEWSAPLPPVMAASEMARHVRWAAERLIRSSGI
ncbi:Aca2/YdiL-like domain-containing protein [Paucibacter soli]|uniref:Aca2/YdiL-like domain-containing protein n=1 Tax=Paucibacter soli TaxID=3133433 RepID=UPI0030AB10BE